MQPLFKHPSLADSASAYIDGLLDPKRRKTECVPERPVTRNCGTSRRCSAEWPEIAKTAIGLAHNETRSWHVSLGMLAFVMLAAVKRRANNLPPQKAAPWKHWCAGQSRKSAGSNPPRPAQIEPAFVIVWSAWRYPLLCMLPNTLNTLIQGVVQVIQNRISDSYFRDMAIGSNWRRPRLSHLTRLDTFRCALTGALRTHH